ncbi:hypothetical protein ABIF20_000764 [Bradyrhizobium japonicum]
MGKSHEKKQAVTPDNLFVFGIDEEGKPRGARFAELNDKVSSAASSMKLKCVHSASAAFKGIAMKLPVGRLAVAGSSEAASICRRSSGADGYLRRPVISWRCPSLRATYQLFQAFSTLSWMLRLSWFSELYFTLLSVLTR